MKSCPQCHRTYTDETLKVCPNDGAQLENGGSDSSMRSGATLALKRPAQEEPSQGSAREAADLVEFMQVSYSVTGMPRPIIDDLNLSVRRGETLVLLGESGCGKTTTLRLVNRLLLPTSGSVFVEGKRTSEWDAIALRRRTGYVIQEAGLFPHFTVERNVALVPTLENWEKDRVRERVRELLQLVGLDPDAFSHRYPRELSGGQRQRVGVARSLAAEPQLLLMDEPFGALDPLTRASLQREFGELSKRLGKTVIFVTHDVREALILGTRIALMHAGKLVLLKTPEEFLRAEEEHARRYVETLKLDPHVMEALAGSAAQPVEQRVRDEH